MAVAGYMNELFSVGGKVVVITGGTGIIGREIALYLAEQGALIVLLGRRAEEGNKIIAAIKNKGGDGIFLTTDVTDTTVLESNLQACLEVYGRVDVLINAAGGNMPGATIPLEGNFLDLDPEAFGEVVNLNLTGTLKPTWVFVKPMIKQNKGVVLNITSMAAFRPMSRVSGYSAAKAGISNLTAFLAHELARTFGESIRVNAIAPGFFLTEQNKFLLTDGHGNLTQRGIDVIRQTPFKRFGKPEELCGTVHYLISEASAFVTGTVAVVDGGFNTFAM
jgi:NAD(P)-dependent dehydrogenase (short-subunit alcohol dehydrogenase family)